MYLPLSVPGPGLGSDSPWTRRRNKAVNVRKQNVCMCVYLGHHAVKRGGEIVLGKKQLKKKKK